MPVNGNVDPPPPAFKAWEAVNAYELLIVLNENDDVTALELLNAYELDIALNPNEEVSAFEELIALFDQEEVPDNEADIPPEAVIDAFDGLTIIFTPYKVSSVNPALNESIAVKNRGVAPEFRIDCITEAVTALLAHEAVPINVPVKEPVNEEVIEVVFNEPVTATLPVTLNDPVITALPLYGNGFPPLPPVRAYEAVVANDAVAASISKPFIWDILAINYFYISYHSLLGLNFIVHQFVSVVLR